MSDSVANSVRLGGHINDVSAPSDVKQEKASGPNEVADHIDGGASVALSLHIDNDGDLHRAGQQDTDGNRPKQVKRGAGDDIKVVRQGGIGGVGDHGASLSRNKEPNSIADAVQVGVVVALMFGVMIGMASSLLALEAVMATPEALEVCRHYVEAAGK